MTNPTTTPARDLSEARWTLDDYDPETDEPAHLRGDAEQEHDCTGEADEVPAGVDMDVTLPPTQDPFSGLPAPLGGEAPAVVSRDPGKLDRLSVGTFDDLPEQAYVDRQADQATETHTEGDS